MFNRWFLVLVVLATVSALIMVIYMDKRERTGRQAQEIRQEGGIPLTASSTPRSREPEELGRNDLDRISLVVSVLDTLRLERAQLPYLGELIRIYSAAGHYRDAARWAGERARMTGDRADLLHAAELHVAAMQQKSEQEQIKEEAKKAKEMYISALELNPDDPDVLTDIAVVYMSLLRPETSYTSLEQALRIDPDHLRANFNMGVLLHQMGNISESVPFFDHALSLAEDPEWRAVVQGYLDRHHKELFHN